MQTQFILSEYIDRAMAAAQYDRLEDGSFAGQIPPCAGVIAFGATLRQCENELRSTLEEWLLLGLKLKHSLPEVGGIDLNEKFRHEPNESLSNKIAAVCAQLCGFSKSASGSKHKFLIVGQSRLTIPTDKNYSTPQFRRLRKVFRDAA